MTGLSPSAKRPLVQVEHRQAANTGGGTFTAGGWRTFPLNTEVVNEVTGASLASNQLTLPAGKFLIRGFQLTFDVGQFVTRLYDTTGTAVLLIGSSGYNETSDGQNARSTIAGEIELAATSALEFQGYCASTFATYGMGNRSNQGGQAERYACIQAWRIP